jgi:acetoin utilization deacetylase AcuC-like enzyme
VHRACIERNSAFRAVDAPRLTQPDFERVHHPAHVREVLDAVAAGPQPSAYAPLATYAVESCAIHYAAASAALGSGFAVALAGDFGGAGYGSAPPPCLLNGLLVTAARLRGEGRVRSVLIVDGNAAYEAGTQGAIEQLGLDWCEYLSLAGDRVGNNFEVASGRSEAVVSGFAGDLVLYQCGTDCCSSASPASYMNLLQWKGRHQQFARLRATCRAPWVFSVGAAFIRSDACVLTEKALRHFLAA